MAGGVVHVDWYAAGLRQDFLAAELARAAPLALRYGATQYSVHRSRTDRYKITQMTWFESERDWYAYWEGPEMIEFRRRNSGKYQIPIVYTWYDELISGALGPEVPLNGAPEPEPQPEPTAAT
ncbi:MAG TPA: hypothetical protein VMD09_13000 [Solirubrobacteraceae bacterium]|nr:hypothetical protein [Solirubrobacteraceae bacterium]